MEPIKRRMEATRSEWEERLSRLSGEAATVRWDGDEYVVEVGGERVRRRLLMAAVGEAIRRVRAARAPIACPECGGRVCGPRG